MDAWFVLPGGMKVVAAQAVQKRLTTCEEARSKCLATQRAVSVKMQSKSGVTRSATTSTLARPSRDSPCCCRRRRQYCRRGYFDHFIFVVVTTLARDEPHSASHTHLFFFGRWSCSAQNYSRKTVCVLFVFPRHFSAEKSAGQILVSPRSSRGTFALSGGQTWNLSDKW